MYAKTPRRCPAPTCLPIWRAPDVGQILTKQYVQGVGQVSGQPMNYPYSWQFDLTVSCPCCNYATRLNAGYSQPSAELVITQEQQPGSQLMITFFLRDPSTGYNLYTHQHTCSGGGMSNVASGLAGNSNTIGRSDYAHSSYAEVDIVPWMQKIEARLNTRFAQEGELARLAGLVPMLTERLAMAKDEAAAANRKNVELTIQIQLIHQSLDCPCEHDFLTEDLDLIGHMTEMGISFTD